MDDRDERVTVSLIVSTYNWPQALNICLLSIENQSVKPIEIIIADDGSTRSTQKVIQDFQQKSIIPVHHVWHEDEGFRLAKIRNRAIAIAKGTYIVQIDGDIILHKHFIKDHLSFAQKNTFVRASRIYINNEVSQKMMQEVKYKIGAFNKGITNFFSALRIPVLQHFFENNYKVKGAERYEIHGCNMAYWRADAIAVNGYNEAFQGWGPEDKEFVARLLNIGKVRRFLKMGGIAFHLHHDESSRGFLEKNQRIMDNTIENKITYCEIGINQYLSNA